MKDALYREWRAGWQMEPPPAFVWSMRRLYAELGADICRDLVSIGPVAVERDSFQLHPGGDWAFLTPVWCVDPELWRFHIWGPMDREGYTHPWPDGWAWTPEMAWRELAEVIDIVAWHPATPGRWAMRTGEADMLGEADAAEALRVHQTPYGWLRANGEGICFLRSERPQIASALRLAGRIVADNAAHARALRDICARPYPIPSIGVAT